MTDEIAIAVFWHLIVAVRWVQIQLGDRLLPAEGRDRA
jgi:hypothetical protein